MRSMIQLIAILALALTTSCGPKAFVKGDYDKDVEKTNLLNDQWSETDMQRSVKELVDSLSKHYTIAGAKTPPLVMVTKLQNKTSEHIDTQSIMDMVKVELMNQSRIQFVDKEAREDIAAEHEYQEGNVTKESQTKKGSQIGADYILNGRLDSIVQEVGKDKTVYYKVTLNMTNIKTNVTVWSNHKQIRKVYKKKSVGA